MKYPINAAEIVKLHAASKYVMMNYESAYDSAVSILYQVGIDLGLRLPTGRDLLYTSSNSPIKKQNCTRQAGRVRNPLSLFLLLIVSSDAFRVQNAREKYIQCFGGPLVQDLRCR